VYERGLRYIDLHISLRVVERCLTFSSVSYKDDQRHWKASGSHRLVALQLVVGVCFMIYTYMALLEVGMHRRTGLLLDIN
jgi:hypothetical protein